MCPCVRVCANADPPGRLIVAVSDRRRPYDTYTHPHTHVRPQGHCHLRERPSIAIYYIGLRTPVGWAAPRPSRGRPPSQSKAALKKRLDRSVSLFRPPVPARVRVREHAGVGGRGRGRTLSVLSASTPRGRRAFRTPRPADRSALQLSVWFLDPAAAAPRWSATPSLPA